MAAPTQHELIDFVPNKSAKSNVWKNFGFYKDDKGVDKKRVVCKLCSNVFKYSGNTTNLNDHMQRKHKDVGKPAATKTQPTLATLLSPKLAAGSNRSSSITSAILQFMVKDLRPYRSVDGGF